MALIEGNRLDFSQLSNTAVCELFAVMRFVSDEEARKNIYGALLIEIERRDITQNEVRSIVASVNALLTPKRPEQHRPKRRTRPSSAEPVHSTTE